MKCRCGFITNSSSSSFVIAYRRNENADPFYQKIIDTILGDGKKLNGVFNDPVEFLLEHFGYDTIENLKADANNGYAKKQYDQMMVCIEKGLTICDVSIDYGCEELFNAFKSLEDGENFIILEED